jgi:PAS domain S-box-containing protein
MKDDEKSKEQLFSELMQLRIRIAELEKAEGERRGVEEALRLSEEKYRLLVETTNECIWELDTHGCFTYLSPNFYDLVGSDPAEFLGRSPLELLPKDDVQRGTEEFWVTMSAREPYCAMERRIMHRDGRLLTVELSGVPFYGLHGEYLGQRGIARDITERKLAVNALQQSEARFRAFMDNSPTTAWIKDEQGRYVYVSKTFEAQHGIRLEPSEKKTDFELWSPEQAEAFRKTDLEVIKSGEPCQSIEAITNPDQETRWWWNFKFPILDASGKSYVGGVGLDITDRKRMEEELRESRAELELRVLERTADLEKANAQLRLLPSMLINAQEEERRRISGELHDSVGQTLAALKYGIETVLVKRDTGDLTGAFELLENFVPTLQQSIEETRSIYMGLRPSIIDSLGLMATLEWFCREFQRVHPGLDIDVNAGIEEMQIPEFLKITVFRIVQEALNNAAKHSRAKRVKLSFLRERDSIGLLIQDDGVGFDPESTMGGDPGRTLGLAGMRERVEVTDGTFSIESEVGKGTCVRAHWLM